MQEFFKHENQSAPASLNDSGKIHTCQKSQLVEILQEQVTLPETEPKGDAIIIIDGSALIDGIPPRSSKAFDAYAREDILPKVESYGSKYKRVDIASDVSRNQA